MLSSLLFYVLFATLCSFHLACSQDYWHLTCVHMKNANQSSTILPSKTITPKILCSTSRSLQSRADTSCTHLHRSPLMVCRADYILSSSSTITYILCINFLPFIPVSGILIGSSDLPTVLIISIIICVDVYVF